MHLRYIARVRSERRRLDGQVGTEVPIDVERVPLNMKVEFEPVSQEEDPILYGFEWVVDEERGEQHFFAELKEARTNGCVSNDAKQRKSVGYTNLNSPEPCMVGSIPEEISGTSSIGNGTAGGCSRAGRSTIGRHAMDVDTAYGSHDEGSNVGGANDEESWFNHLQAVENEMQDDIRNGKAFTNPTASPSPTATEYTEETYASAKSSGSCVGSRCGPPKKKEKKIRQVPSPKKAAKAPPQRSTASMKSPPAASASKRSSVIVETVSGASVCGSVSGRSVRTTKTARTSRTTMTTRSSAAKRKVAAGLKTTGLPKESKKGGNGDKKDDDSSATPSL